MKKLKLVLSGNVIEGQEPYWSEVLSDLLMIDGETLNEEKTKILNKILAFNGELKVIYDIGIPSSKLPEDMLKFIAKQILGLPHE